MHPPGMRRAGILLHVQSSTPALVLLTTEHYGYAQFPRRPLLGSWVNRGNLLARVDMFSDSGHVSFRKGRGGKDNERAEGTSACSCEGTIRRIPNIETEALRGPMRAQAPKRGSRGVYASRRWLCGALPVVR